MNEAVSFAVPDDMYGETVGVAIILRDDNDKSNTNTAAGAGSVEDDLKMYMRGKVAGFKVPTRVSFFF